MADVGDSCYIEAMPTTSVRRAWLSRTVARWRALPAGRRWMIVLFLAMAGMAGLWVPSFWETEWPTKAVLRTPRDTWLLDFSPDSRTLATWGGEGITLWDVATGRERTTWKRADGQTAAMGVFAPDGRTFASLHSAYPGPITIDLIDVETGRSRASLPTQHSRIYGLVFTDEGRSLRAFLGDMNNLKQAVTWDVATGKETGSRTYTCLIGAADTMISPDGRLMALTPFCGKTIQIWDLDKGQVISRLTHPSSSLRLARVRLLPGQSDAGRRPRGWLLRAVGPGDATLTTTFRGHTDGHVAYGIQLAPDGRTLASTASIRNPRRWRAVVSRLVLRAVHRHPVAPGRTQRLQHRRPGRAGSVAATACRPGRGRRAARRSDAAPGWRTVLWPVRHDPMVDHKYWSSR